MQVTDASLWIVQAGRSERETGSEPTPAPLAVLAQALATARPQGYAASALACPVDEPSKRALAKRRHDVKAALRTMGFTLKALQDGYKFDDDKAKAKIDAIAKALAVLEKEGDLLARLMVAD